MKTKHLFLTAVLLIAASVAPLTATVKNIAHRGASSVAPENTLAAFHKAAEVGADYFELDVQLSKDDSLVIMHDKAVNKTTDGSGFVVFLTYEQLRQFDAGSWFDPAFAGEKIPTLKEALLQGKQDSIKVCIELKSEKEGIVDKVIDLVEKLKMENEVIIFSFTLEQIAQAKELNETIPVLYLADVLSSERIDSAEEIGAQAIGIGGDISVELRDYCRQKNVELWKWTVNDSSEMEELLTLDVDGIITDYPQVLKQVIASDVHVHEKHVADYELRQNFPNPFNPETTIEYSIPAPEFVELAIFNIRGEKLHTLVHQQQAAGVHQTFWNGTDDRGRPAPSGIYFYQIKSGDFIKFERMILAR